ncbi:hypothetical protein BV20DRAFT_959858 [Pilatotrama ljubarskyi]|nr:hypothetical protein BV20DRAFT_959858 [Pilatotrama ljubarskyi]
MSADGVLSLDSTLGVELVGFGIALVLYGITSAQAVAYLRRYGRPPLPPCIYFVLVLWFVDTLHIALVSYLVALYLVLQHSNPESVLRPPWAFGVVVLISEINGALVRVGYAYRIWKFSGRRALVPCIIIASTAVVLGVGLAFTSHEVHLTSWKEGRVLEWTLYTSYSCQIFVDGLITTMMFLLLRRFRTGHRRLDLLIKTLVMFVVNTGFLTTVGVTLSIVFVCDATLRPRKLPSSRSTVYHTTANLHICRLVLSSEQTLHLLFPWRLEHRTAPHAPSWEPSTRNCCASPKLCGAHRAVYNGLGRGCHRDAGGLGGVTRHSGGIHHGGSACSFLSAAHWHLGVGIA